MSKEGYSQDFTVFPEKGDTMTDKERIQSKEKKVGKALESIFKHLQKRGIFNSQEYEEKKITYSIQKWHNESTKKDFIKISIKNGEDEILFSNENWDITVYSNNIKIGKIKDGKLHFSIGIENAAETGDNAITWAEEEKILDSFSKIISSLVDNLVKDMTGIDEKEVREAKIKDATLNIIDFWRKK